MSSESFIPGLPYRAPQGLPSWRDKLDTNLQTCQHIDCPPSQGHAQALEVHACFAAACSSHSEARTCEPSDRRVDGLLEKALKLAGLTALTFVPVPYLTEAAEALIGVIEKVEGTRSTQTELKDLAKEIGELARLLTDGVFRLKDTAASDEQAKELIKRGSGLQHYRTELGRFVMELRKIAKLAQRLHKQSFASRLLFSERNAKTFQDLKAKVNAVITRVHTLNLMKLAQDAAITSEMMRRTDELMRRTAAENALERLPRADAGYKAAGNHMKSKFLEGTREDLFTSLIAWARGDDANTAEKSVCILSGAAGSGKSTIAVELARRLDSGDLGASFFFATGDAERSSTRLFFPTIAYQVAKSQPNICRFIVKAVSKHLEGGQHQQLQYEATNLLKNPLSSVERHHPTVILVVDALDECAEPIDHKQFGVMMNLLVSCAAEAPFPVKILFTSRPKDIVEDTITTSVGSSAKIHNLDLNDRSRESMDRDVKILIRHELKTAYPGRDLLEGRDELVDRLVEGSEGSMLYGATASGFLTQKPDYIDERARHILSSPERARYLGPLYDLYLKVLEKEYPEEDLKEDPTTWRHLKRVLGALALLRDRLSPVDLEPLLDIRVKDSTSVLSNLRSVILYKRGDVNEPFRPIHSSFVHFLLENNFKEYVFRGHDKIRYYHINSTREHTRIAAGCLRILGSSDLRRNPLNVDSGTRRSNVADVNKRVEEEIPRHVRYACLHWVDHLEQSEWYPEVVKASMRLTERTLYTWVETMAWMRRLDAALSELEGVSRWKTVDLPLPELDRIYAWLKDKFDIVKDRPEEIYNGGYVARAIQVGRWSDTGSEDW
ncbi:uncharacterized protein BXZ73DRAFT_107645 [Epithele typhae]|uniref:uncharacterized protein n=1 Tax=Epithele typhae TaxID=378194 RepID=UPI00200789C8|nr:uncharacterized protein BXZ73DRAFT_107645 [Epithele typhae]KAH9912099.1 hypothetical protein BXZ73DRAFT_107645 [Epithele typhae]